MSATGVRSTIKRWASLTGSMPVPPMPNPVWSPLWFMALAPKRLWDRPRHFYTYDLKFQLMNGGESRVQFLPILEAGGFLLIGLSILVVQNGNPPTRPSVDASTCNYLLQVTPQSEGQGLFSQPLPVESICSINGGPNSPSVMVPVFFEQGETLAIQLTSLWQAGVAVQTNVDLSLRGAVFS